MMNYDFHIFRTSINRHLLTYLAGGVLMLASGCSRTDDKRMQPTVPAAVEVFYQGKPVGDCQVVLHPVVEKSTPLRRVLPNGQTNAEGRAQLTSYIANDGAPEGEYVVTLACKPVVGEQDGEPIHGPDKFEGRYASIKDSPLRSIVTKENQAPLRIEAK